MKPPLFVVLCGSTLRVNCQLDWMREVISAYLAPAIIEPVSLPDIEVELTSSQIKVTRGPHPQAPRTDWSPLVEFDWLLGRWCILLSPHAVAMHAGCVLLGESPLLFVAPSGGGKSTLTKAAVQAGAAYLTDDMVLLHGDKLKGLARAIRFESFQQNNYSYQAYLSDMDTESYKTDKSPGARRFPLFWKNATAIHELDVSRRECIVVTVQRGKFELRKISDIERAVALQEAAIVEKHEYDGRLGTGPGYSLTWEEPASAFQSLQRALQQRNK